MLLKEIKRKLYAPALLHLADNKSRSIYILTLVKLLKEVLFIKYKMVNQNMIEYESKRMSESK